MTGFGLHLSSSGGIQLRLTLGGIVLEILAADEGGGEFVRSVVGGGLFLRRLVVGSDDQRRPRLVDQDAVGLVHHGEIVASLDGLRALGGRAAAEERLLERLPVPLTAALVLLALVAEEVEAEFLAG